MKNFIAILVFAISFSAVAQQNQNNRKGRQFNQKFDVEQRATIKSKKMALHLDLSQQQQQKIYALILKQEQKIVKFRKNRKANMGNYKPLSQSQKFNRINKGLDAKLAFQSELKNILNNDQYATWKKINAKKSQNKAPRGRNSRR